MAQHTFDIIRLFDFNAEAHGIDGGFNQHTFVLIANNTQRHQDGLLGHAV